jgi:hypothetical protein
LSMSNEHGHLYVVVRDDLTNAQRTVQAAHAAIEVARNKELKHHPNLVILTARDEPSLHKLLDTIDLPIEVFREPDRNNEVTAVAAGPLYGEDRRKFRKFKMLK